MRQFVSSCVFIFLLSYSCLAGPNEDKLLNMSVTVKTDRGTGSGTFYKYKDKYYVLTAGHVVSSLRTTKDGKETYGKCTVSQTLFKNGKEVGEISRKAKLVALSPPEEEGGIDLALLEVAGFAGISTLSFDEDSKLDIGERIFHIGSLYGDITNSFIIGHVARLDFTLESFPDSVFNVVNLNGRPGSSGGGVFVNRGGKFFYAGMVVRGDSGGIMLTKPIEVIKAWLKEVSLGD